MAGAPTIVMLPESPIVGRSNPDTCSQVRSFSEKEACPVYSRPDRVVQEKNKKRQDVRIDLHKEDLMKHLT